MKKYLILAFILSSVHTFAFESAPSYFFTGSTYSGHEEITRQSLNNISKKIKNVDSANTIFDLAELNFDLLPEPHGLFGYKSQNMVIHGNFSSDFPSQTNILSLPDFWNNRGMNNFEDPKSQVIHFLRNYKDEVTLASARETCLGARANIKYVTSEALKAWAAGDKTKALFLIGHATHMIQDSFSPAHTLRDDEAHNSNLKNVCFFGVNMYKNMDMSPRNPNPELCYHKAPDSQDAIWNIEPSDYKKALASWGNEKVSQCNKSSAYPTTEEQKNSCMSHEARLARVATEKYFLLIFRAMSPSNLMQLPIDLVINSLDVNLFDGPVGDAELDAKMPNGIIRCEGLSDKVIFGANPINDRY